MSKKIYLANPYGFSTQQKEKLLPEIQSAIQSISPNVVVWEPFYRAGQSADFNDPQWAYTISQKDMDDCRNCDAIFAVVNGTPPDEGVMIELGMCVAWGKKVFLFRDDFRKCNDSNKYPLNLMVFVGLDQYRWEESYYTSVGDITNPNKELFKWITKGR